MGGIIGKLGFGLLAGIHSKPGLNCDCVNIKSLTDFKGSVPEALGIFGTGKVSEWRPETGIAGRVVPAHSLERCYRSLEDSGQTCLYE